MSFKKRVVTLLFIGGFLLIFLSYQTQLGLKDEGSSQSPKVPNFFYKKSIQYQNTPPPILKKSKNNSINKNSAAVASSMIKEDFPTPPDQSGIKFTDKSKLELYKCFPTMLRDEDFPLEVILSDWEKANPSQTVNLLYQNFHFIASDGTELRLRISPKIMNSGQLHNQVQLFNLDRDGDPVLRALPVEFSGKSAEEIIEILIKENKLIRTEDVKQYQSKNNQSIQVTKINNQIVNWDSKIKFAYFSCQLNTESHLQDCLCTIKK